jgi:group I intron endonuclease
MMPFYIYRHTRPDTNEVFYVGKGNNLDKRKPKYFRAQFKKRRSIFWNKVVLKNNGNYEVEIIFECENESFCNKKEKEFISLYGRRDIGKGTLVNLTDGGDGSSGLVYTNEMREKLIKRLKENHPRLGSKHSEKSKEAMSESAKQRTCKNPFKGKIHTEENIQIFKEIASKRGDSPRCKKVINISTGEIFKTAKLAAKSINCNYRNLSAKHFKNNYENNKTPLIYLSDYYIYGDEGSRTFTSKPNKPPKGMYKKVFDIVTGKEYESIRQAADELNLDVSTLRRRLQGLFTNNTNLRYA